jgi:putative membrane protein
MGASAAHVTSHTMGLSVLSGVALVGIGVAVNINAIVRHVIVVRELSSGRWVPEKIPTSAVALAGLLAIVGIGMALYLLIVR